MIPFHSIFPEVAQREVRCVRIEEGDIAPADEYAYVEFYCEDLECDCRRVCFQVISKSQQDKIWASIGYGWEDEGFYRKNAPWDPDSAKDTVRGYLDPINPQSELADFFLDLFRHAILDVPYSLRLRRHYRLFRDELARRKAAGQEPRP